MQFIKQLGFTGFFSNDEVLVECVGGNTCRIIGGDGVTPAFCWVNGTVLSYGQRLIVALTGFNEKKGRFFAVPTSLMVGES